MIWIALAAGTVSFVELFQRLGLSRRIAALAVSGRKAASIVRSSAISDHWKERALLAYARRVFIGTLALFGLLIACAAPALLLLAIASMADPTVWEAAGSPAALVLASLTAVVYVSGKKQFAGR